MHFKISLILASLIAGLYMPPAAAWEYGLHEDVFNGNTKYGRILSDNRKAILSVIEESRAANDGVAFIATNEYFCSNRNDEVNMRYIIDGKQDSAYILVSDSGDIVYPSFGIPDFVQKLIDGNELIVRISDRCGDIVDYEFDISGDPTKEWR